jgi:hypothetical protein
LNKLIHKQLLYFAKYFVKQMSENMAAESKKLELTLKAEALEVEKEQLALNIERLTQDWKREAAAKEALESGKEEIVDMSGGLVQDGHELNTGGGGGGGSEDSPSKRRFSFAAGPAGIPAREHTLH